MSIPVNRLKLMAFAFGSGIAGLAGCIFAAVLTAVTPGELRPAAPDHDLRDRDPRRHRQPDRRRPRRDRDQRLVPVPRAREPADQRAAALLRVLVLLLVLVVRPPGGGSALVAAACSRSASSRRRSSRRSRRRGPAGAVVEGGRLAGVVGDWVVIPAGHGRFAERRVRLRSSSPSSRSPGCTAGGGTLRSCRPSTSPRSSGRPASSSSPRSRAGSSSARCSSS